MKIEKKKLTIIVVIVVLVISNFLSYRIGMSRVNKNAKKILAQLNDVTKIDFDYINALNALRQRTLEWGQIQTQISANATASAEEVQTLRDSSDQAIKDIEELTKVTLSFRAARENYMNQDR